MKTKILSAICIFAILFISCSGDDSNIPGLEGETPAETSLLTYNNIEFAFTSSANSNGRAFSTITGKLYADADIFDDIGAIIDLVSITNQTFVAFISPDQETDITIPNATMTKVQHTNVSITATEFDDMTDDSVLKGLSIVDDNESISISDFKDKIILFENSGGKKGAIKLESLNLDAIKVTIKVIK